jgi:hypothetical protein
MAANKSAYVVLLTKLPSHKSHPAGAVGPAKEVTEPGGITEPKRIVVNVVLPFKIGINSP